MFWFRPRWGMPPPPPPMHGVFFGRHRRMGCGCSALLWIPLILLLLALFRY